MDTNEIVLTGCDEDQVAVESTGLVQQGLDVADLAAQDSTNNPKVKFDEKSERWKGVKKSGARRYDWIDLSAESIATMRRVDLSQMSRVDNHRQKHVTIEEFHFVESCAHNTAFDRLRNDGQARVYIPAQNKKSELYVCSFDIKDKNPSCEYVAKITTKVLRDGHYVEKKELTCFGAELSDDGILWLAIFNLNLILGYDLIGKYVKYQFNDIPAPNDIALSPDGSIVYAACGFGFKRPSLYEADNSETLAAVTPTIGNIRELRVIPQSNRPKDSRTTYILPHTCNTVIYDEDMSSLAGIEVMDGKIYYAQLFDLHSVQPPIVKDGSKPAGKRGKDGLASSNRRVWDGTWVGDGRECFLMDNLSTWKPSDATNELLVGAIYRKAPLASVRLMKAPIVSTSSWCITKALCCLASSVTATYESQRTGRIDMNAMTDAEMPLWMSKLDVFNDLCFAVLDDKNRKAFHFRVQSISEVLSRADGGAIREAFDGHVTDVSIHGGSFIFINFMTKHILLMDETEVKRIILEGST